MLQILPKNVFEAILRYGHDEDFDPPNLDFNQTSAPAGSDSKIAVLRKRLELGQPLWHDEDRVDYAGYSGPVERAEQPPRSALRSELRSNISKEVEEAENQANSPLNSQLPTAEGQSGETEDPVIQMYKALENDKTEEDRKLFEEAELSDDGPPDLASLFAGISNPQVCEPVPTPETQTEEIDLGTEEFSAKLRNTEVPQQSRPKKPASPPKNRENKTSHSSSVARFSSAPTERDSSFSENSHAMTSCASSNYGNHVPTESAARDAYFRELTAKLRASGQLV